MNVYYWRGDTPAIADVWTLTITGPATANGTIEIPIGLKTVTIPFTNGDSAAVITANVGNALANSEILEFAELTWTNDGVSVVTGTMNAAGVPTVISAPVVTGAAGVTCVQANATVATGPSFADNAANWSLNELPGTHNYPVIIDGGADIKYGLSGMFVGAVTSIRVLTSFSGSWGLPRRNTAAGSDGYFEFRPIGCSVATAACDVFIGDSDTGSGGGPVLVRLMLGNGQRVFVESTGTSIEDGVPAVDCGRQSGTPGQISVYGGSAGYGVVLDTATTALAVASITAGTLFTYGDVTVFNQRNGVSFARGTNPTINILDGTYTQEAGHVTDITADGGTVRLNHDQSTDVIVAIFRGSLAGDPPVLDLSQNDRQGKYFGSGSSFTGGAFLLDPYKNADLTAVNFDQSSFQASTIGRTFAITRPHG